MISISVIVPVYKVEPFIIHCLDSILAQTFIDFELILVDDGTPDDCGAICDEYAEKDSRIRVIHQINGGLSVARNAGIDWAFACSDSNYISFVDSDDWIHPQFLELLRKVIQKYQVNICQCGLTITDKRDTEIKEITGMITAVTPEEQFLNYHSSYMPDKLFKKSCWLQYRFPEGKIYEDSLICYQMLFSENMIGIVEDQLYYYYMNPKSIIHRDWLPEKLTQIIAWENEISFYKKRGNKRIVEAARARFCKVLATQLTKISASRALAEKEKKRYYRLVQRKLRRVLLLSRSNSDISKDINWYRSLAFPKLDWLYWAGKNLANKIRKNNDRYNSFFRRENNQ